MPEGTEGAVETPTLSEETQTLLTKYGLKDVSQLDEVFGTYKTDLQKFKADNKDLSASQKKLLELEAAAEEKRKAELSEIDGLKEKKAADAKSIADLQAKIAGMEKSQLYNTTLFEHGTGKPLIGIRKTLYAAAAGSQVWETDKELKEIFTAVDTDFEKAIKEGTTQVAPGDRRFVSLPGSDTPVKSDYFNQ